MMPLEFDFITDLCESKLIPSKTSLKKWDVKKISELTYLYFLGLRMLLHDTHNRKWAQEYCEKAGQNTDFSTFRTTGNDLYVMLYALTGDPDDTDEKTSLPHRINISPNIIRQWLRNATNKDETHKMFARLDAMFMIDNSSMKSMRRLLMNIEDMNNNEKQDTLNKIVQLISSRANYNCEIMPHLKSLKYKEDDKINEFQLFSNLQFENNDNRFIYHGTSSTHLNSIKQHGLIDPNEQLGCVMFHSNPNISKIYSKSSTHPKIHGGFPVLFRVPLSKVNVNRKYQVDNEGGIVFNVKSPVSPEILEIEQDGKWKPLLTISESASSGGTSAASVATIVGGLGAGFDNDYSKSIYNHDKKKKKEKAKKPLIIKR